MPEIVVEPLDPKRGGALAALFEREGSPCYCRYWHFSGTNKEWQARCGLEPEQNRRELAAAMGTLEASGLLAMEGDLAVGWMKLSPRLPKLLSRLPYRDLDDPGPVLAIGCFLVDPAHRRRGVAARLVDAAIAFAPTRGARFLEAYPRVSEAPLHDGEAWQGPHALFLSRGFVVVRDAPQYPVLRRAV